VCGHIDEADDIADDMELFHGRRPEVVPALELGGSLGQVSEEQVANRLQLVAKLVAAKQAAGGRQQGDGASQTADSSLLVAPIHAVMQSVPSNQQLRELMWTLRPGAKVEPEKLIVWLAD